MRYIVIMAGGAGTRLWPLSRQGTPKQLLPLVGGKSLLRLSFDRALAVVPPERIMVVTGAAYASEVRDELPEMPPANLLGEPVGRDSLGAVSWPAAVLAELDPDAVIAQLTADHIIEPLDAFVTSLKTAFEVAEAMPDTLVTLGVVPTSPHTGYGYLHKGDPISGFPEVCQVSKFREKPDLPTAQRYLSSGDYWWNSGMFVWRAATLLSQVAQLVPDMHAGVLELARNPGSVADVFPLLPKASVDFAIMEPVSRGQGSARIAAVALPVSWRDVGGFDSLADALPTDASGNVVEGQAVVSDADGNLIYNTDGDGHVVAVLGLSGMVIVHTPTATLVTTRDRAEHVKALVETIRAEVGPQFT